MKRKNVSWWILGLVVVFLALVVYAIIPSTPWCLALERKDAVTALIALAGVVGVVFTIRQTQKRITQQERQQRDTRFASGVELLGNPHESTRIGGAYNLYFLARDFAEFRPAVCEILCAHLRTIAHKDKFETDEQRAKYPRNEVQSIIDLLFRKHETDESGDEVSIFLKENKNLREIFLFKIDFGKQEKKFTPRINNVGFSDAALNTVNFHRSTLTEVIFEKAALIEVGYQGTTLYHVYFTVASLTKVNFSGGATLTRVYFDGVHLTEVYFSGGILGDGVLFGGVATLTEVAFSFASLTKVYFFESPLTSVDFMNADLIEGTVDFEGTPLAGYSYKEITRPGRSLELTSPKATEPTE